MGVAITAILIISLVIGVAYQSLEKKNDRHEDLMETSHQLQKN
jgi:L-cystine uptake protein TcyP (sodium:dicarboxylate symporter family)